MDIKRILELQEAGVDTEGALRRFGGNSVLYERFLKKFLSDPTFGDLARAFEIKDEEGALVAAHTFKGVTANLGLTRLYGISSEMVASIRNRDFSEAFGRYPDLKASYDEICEILLKS